MNFVRQLISHRNGTSGTLVLVHLWYPTTNRPVLTALRDGAKPFMVFAWI